MLPFLEDLDGAKIHVQAPTEVVFLCGGICSSIKEPIPLSLRDAFTKFTSNPATDGKDVFCAEDISVLSIFSESYTDLLAFETDLAEITELIILFCESEGSLAELGAFAMVREISSKLLVIIRDGHWESDSFVRLGPLRAIENSYGATAIYVLDDLDIGMRRRSASVAGIKMDVLKERLQGPIRSRLKETRVPTTFTPTIRGHIIKLIVGLIQEYGALTVKEIGDALSSLGVEIAPDLIVAYMLCAKVVNWVAKKRKGSTDYYFVQNVPDAATLVWKGDTVKNKVRRRFLIREHWKKTDDLRFNGISEAFTGRSL